MDFQYSQGRLTHWSPLLSQLIIFWLLQSQKGFRVWCQSRLGSYHIWGRIDMARQMIYSTSVKRGLFITLSRIIVTNVFPRCGSCGYLCTLKQGLQHKLHWIRAKKILTPCDQDTLKLNILPTMDPCPGRNGLLMVQMGPFSNWMVTNSVQATMALQ